MNRAPSLAVCIAAWVALLAATACRPAAPEAPPQSPREVEVVTLSLREVRDTSDYIGTLLSRGSTAVASQVNGYVRKIHVAPGQRVEAGAPLVDVDAREEAAALDSAVALRGAADARLELARRTASRTQALYEEGLVSAQEVERARADLDAAHAGTRAAGAAVSQRRVQVGLHTIRAAVPGVVGDVVVNSGDYVEAGAPLTSVAQGDELEVGVAIPAARARALPAAAKLEIVDASGRVIVATNIYYAAPQADPATQLVDVKAVFDNTQGLRPSEVVHARVVFGARRALQVPAVAVVRQSGQPFVFVVVEDEGVAVVQRRPVTLGPLIDQSYVVEAGLQAGDHVAASSLQALKDGAPVRPKVVAAAR